MTEKDYKELLIEFVKDHKEVSDNNRYNLLKGINTMKLHIEKTSIRIGRNDYKAYVRIKIVRKYFKILNDYADLLEELFDKIFCEEGYCFSGLSIILDSYEIDEDDMPEVPMVPEYFSENIEDVIIEHIKKAKWHIYVAMYCLKNENIYKELQRKKQEGVHVEIVLNDSQYNRDAAVCGEGLNIHYTKPTSTNPMHLKVCIIDMKEVIHGSYNWTKSANYNTEACSIDSNNSSVMFYMNMFGELRNSAA